MQLDVNAIRPINGDRPDTEAKQDELYFSIKELGLLQPIVVMEEPDDPNSYRVISGRRRLATVRRLGWQYIDATVRTFDEVHAEMAEIAENLHRLELSPALRDKAFLRYKELYEGQHPELAEEREAAHQRSVANFGAALLETEPEGVEEAAPEGVESPVPAAEKPKRGRPRKAKSSVEAVAEKFDVSTATVRQAIKRAEVFTSDQRQALELSQVPLHQIDRIALIPEMNDRDQVINLIAGQMDFAAAMREVLGDRFEGVDEDADLTDEEFLDSLPIRKRVNKEKFDADAMLYRTIQKARITFGRSIGWGALKKTVGQHGAYYRLILRLLECKHPREWVVCHSCTRGQTQRGECTTCRGGGYQLG